MRNITFILLFFIAGCSSFDRYVPDPQQLDTSALPESNISASIPNISNCTDASDPTINIDIDSPITVLVHGCKSSAGRFRSLAQLYAFHGQQAICFSYDDRGSLVDAAKKLAESTKALSELSHGKQHLTIIGHSMGGLVARKAVEKNDFSLNILPPYLRDVNSVDLITVSAPLSGIDAAKHCGVKSLQWLSAGIVPGICWAVTGSNWTEITSTSSFIQEPESLSPLVGKYLKIVTNEEGTCRKTDTKGRCVESDFVFDVAEQYHPIIDSYQNVTGVEVNAGHVEIVGNKDIVPRKLLAILQENGALSKTPKARKAEFELLLADLYLATKPH